VEYRPPEICVQLPEQICAVDGAKADDDGGDNEQPADEIVEGTRTDAALYNFSTFVRGPSQ
jgi:hypothetical protein